jgi:sulfate transport system permease protein
LLPLANVFAQALAKGWAFYWKSLAHPDSRAAIRLTLTVAAISVPLNVVFGLAAAWAIAKFQFRGKSLLITLIDLPFSVSPVVAGLMFLVLLGLRAIWANGCGPPPAVIFAAAGLVLATVFITFRLWRGS